MHKSGFCLFACTIALGLLAGNASAKDAAGLFDKPLKVVRVALPRDKDNPQAKPEVRCSYYPEFMIKEIDLGEIGAFQLSIIPGRDTACMRKNAANEKIVSPNDWTGYFKGVSGDYIFFDAEDGWNGGLGFAVFTPDAKKLFDDVAKDWAMVAAVAPPGPAGIKSGHALALRYTRIFGAKCSLAARNGDACWAKIEHDTGLAGPMPDCRADYAREQKRTPNADVLNDPTAIEYDSATTIAFNGVHVTAVSGKQPVCKPED
jgi:hypothetical protein